MAVIRWLQLFQENKNAITAKHLGADQEESLVPETGECQCQIQAHVSWVRVPEQAQWPAAQLSISCPQQELSCGGKTTASWRRRTAASQPGAEAGSSSSENTTVVCRAPKRNGSCLGHFSSAITTNPVNRNCINKPSSF